MARRLGICANIRFPFPNHFVEELFRAVLPDRAGSPAFDAEVLTWRIMGPLPGCLDGEGFEPLKEYLADDGRGLKRYQLCRNIGRLFDQYLVYRPDMVLGWKRAGSATGRQPSGGGSRREAPPLTGRRAGRKPLPGCRGACPKG